MPEHLPPHAYAAIDERAATRRSVKLLKQRRDELVSRACNRDERDEIMVEVRRINADLARMLEDLGESY